MRSLLSWFLGSPVAAPHAGRARVAPPPARPAPVVDPLFGDAAAHRVRAQLKSGNAHGLQTLLAETTDHDDRAFYVNALCDWPGRQAWIAEWLKREPRSATASLVAGRHAIYVAWQARGSRYAKDVSEEAWRPFFNCLEAADKLLHGAAEFNPDDPAPWAFMLTTARGLQMELEDVRARFHQLTRRAPFHLIGHQQMLQKLCAKWSGSHEQMFDFARQAAAAAPSGSALHALTAHAHVERWMAYASDHNEDMVINYFRSREVLDELHARAAAAFDPAVPPTLDTIPARNTFAFCFHMGGQREAAAEQFRHIGGWVAHSPWCHLGEPVAVFTKAAAASGIMLARAA